MLRSALLIAFACVLYGCAPISEDQCRGGDWGGIGLADGKKGRTLPILEKYAETCAEFGTLPDRELYLQGREAGLKFYCTAENAYEIGRDGRRLNRVCTPEVTERIWPAYERGRRFHELETEIEALKDRIDDLEQEVLGLSGATQDADGRVQASILRARIRDLRQDIFVLGLRQERYASLR